MVFGKTGGSASFAGFGGYRIRSGVAEHHEALALALDSGISLIDTSPSYGDGASEQLIGEVLRGFPAKRFTLITKAGYLQGRSLEAAKEQLFPETVKIHEDFWHCISPKYLSWQIGESLKRLGVSRIDLLLLHNPEHFLKAESHLGEYYRRIETAFRHLEEEAQTGRILYYGVSSNTLAPFQREAETTSLERLIEIAAGLGSSSRFAAIQFPFNLFEADAALERDPQGRSLLEMAEAAGLGVLLNRPLNAMRGREPLRLAPFPGHHGIDVEGALQAALSRVMEMESRAPEQQVTPAENLAWGHILRDNINRLSDIVSWKETRDARILPRFIPAMEALAKERELRDWSLPYRTAVEDLFAAFTRFVEARSAATARTLSAELHRLCPELRSSPTLSQKVLRIYRSVPGAGPILVGMRRASYVRDVLGAEPPIAPRVALELLAHFRVVR